MAPEKQSDGQVIPVQKKKTFQEEPLSNQAKKKCERWLRTPKPKDSTKIEMDGIFFHCDKFELIVDARGYRPEDVKCTVRPNAVEIVAEKINGNQFKLSTSRKYEFKQTMDAEQAVCSFTSDGILLVTVPWQK